MRLVLSGNRLEDELVNWTEFWQLCVDIDGSEIYMATLHEILEA